MFKVPGICVALSGGLGNQMFQYAAGRSLSVRYDVPLSIDLSFFLRSSEGWTPRSYALQEFGIKATIADTPRVISKVGWRQHVEHFIHPSRFVKLIERKFSFDPELWERAPKHSYLEGYWQSELYFAPAARMVRSDFSAHKQSREHAESFALQIKSADKPIAIHVRRGDYVTNRSAASFHGLCTPEYYRDAISTIREPHPHAHCFVISDDPDWCEQSRIAPPPATIVHGNSAHEDLWLMSLCRHHVIANSSFSWWGAWLANSATQIVIAPRRWFLDDSIDTSTLIPSRWTRL